MNKIISDRLYIASFSQNFIDGIKEFNIGMELNHTCVSDCLDDDMETRGSFISQIRSDINASNAKSLITHGPFTEIYPSGIDYKMRELGLLRLNQAYDVSKHFNINKMVVHNGWLPLIYFKSWHVEKGGQFWQKFMKDKPENFTIFIENVLEDEPYMLRNMVDKISDSRIKLCLDIGHANVTTTPDLTIIDWIKILGENIGHFHLHNNDGTVDSHHVFSEGSIDIGEILDFALDYLPEDTTFTIESRDCLPCLTWLKDKGYI